MSDRDDKLQAPQEAVEDLEVPEDDAAAVTGGNKIKYGDSPSDLKYQ